MSAGYTKKETGDHWMREGAFYQQRSKTDKSIKKHRQTRRPSKVRPDAREMKAETSRCSGWRVGL